MCNIWPQGTDFNLHKWQALEFICDAYALNRKCLILSGPIFSDGFDNCLDPGTRGVVPCSESTSPIKIPGQFYKILVDLERKIYWCFISENNFVKKDQSVKSMLTTLNAINNAHGSVVTFNFSDEYTESQSCCSDGDILQETTTASQCDN
jgi:DNA/RNA endonuclease G (NUC1)